MLEQIEIISLSRLRAFLQKILDFPLAPNHSYLLLLASSHFGLCIVAPHSETKKPAS
jgi:hypothetical protein